MIKRLTMVRRAEATAPGDFGNLWLEEVRGVLDRMPTGAWPSRLAHCVVRRRPGVEPPWDGVAIHWFGDAAALETHDLWWAGHGREDSVTDPGATTVVPVEERTVRGQEWLNQLWAEGDGDEQLLLIALIEAAPGLTKTQFRDYWWDKHRPLANSIVPLEIETAAYVHNYATATAAFPWTGIGELYEESIETARQRGAWMATDAAAPLDEDERRFMNQAGRRVLVTDHQIVVNQSGWPAA